MKHFFNTIQVYSRWFTVLAVYLEQCQAIVTGIQSVENTGQVYSVYVCEGRESGGGGVG